MIYSLSKFIDMYNIERNISYRNVVKYLFLPAQYPFVRICAPAFEILKIITPFPKKIPDSRQSEKDCKNHSKCLISVLNELPVNLYRCTYQVGQDTFFQTLYPFDAARLILQKTVLIKARIKAEFKVFIDLNQRLSGLKKNRPNYLRWISASSQCRLHHAYASR